MEKKLIVGLGNPGKKYSITRHNIGFMAVEAYADSNGFKSSKEACSSIISTKVENGIKTILAKPLTFMNLSGKAIVELKKKFAVSNENILVVVDDVNLPFCKLRFREKGSHGGHNGLLSIIEELGTVDFPRLRIGVNPPPEGIDRKNYVLMKFLKEELDRLKKDDLSNIVKAIDGFIHDDIKSVMNMFN